VSWSRIQKELILFVLVQFLVSGSSQAFLFKRKNDIKKGPPKQIAKIDEKALLKSSHISYRAVGGFTGVKSFSVLISCVDGRVSILKTIHNPKGIPNRPTLRHNGAMTTKAYMEFWDNLVKQQIMQIPDCPDPRQEILEEFTFHFEARVGDEKHSFRSYGLTRPEASRYFALKNLIDSVADMASLWDRHGKIAQK